MGTLLQLRLVCPDDLVCENAFRIAADTVSDLDDKMSLYHDSELRRVNTEAGRKSMPVSEDTFYVASAAADIAAKSDGFFDPTIAPVLDAWQLYSGETGIDVSPVSDDALRAAARLVNFRNIKLDKTHRRIGLAFPGMKMDLGGIAKGYTLDRISARLKRLGLREFSLDFGGHLLTHNLEHTSAILHPVTGRLLLVCRLKEGSLSASAQNERYVKSGGRRIGHILNPLDITEQAEPERIALVYSSSAMQADAWSTALFFPDREKFLRWTRVNGIAAWRFGGGGLWLRSRAAADTKICSDPG